MVIIFSIEAEYAIVNKTGKMPEAVNYYLRLPKHIRKPDIYAEALLYKAAENYQKEKDQRSGRK